MITLYTLNQSRSQRIAWLLEELGVAYKAVIFERDSQTKLAPEDLKQIHPLGKAPIITDDDTGELTTIAESGAIVEYLIDRYGQGKLKPAINTANYTNYLQWIHYAEGSLAFALIANMYAGDKFSAFCHSQVGLQLGYVEQHLAEQAKIGNAWFVGNTLTGADILMSFPLQAALAHLPKDQFPHIHRFVEQVENHPNYLKANDKIGKIELEKLGQ